MGFTHLCQMIVNMLKCGVFLKFWCTLQKYIHSYILLLYDHKLYEHKRVLY